MENKGIYFKLLENSKLLEGNPCKKQSVYAVIITKDGNMIFGSNNINNNVEVCPRVIQNMRTGEGYHLCKEICNQNNHAEQDAIDKANKLNINIENSNLYLIGHTYFCDNCLNKMKQFKLNSSSIISLSDRNILNVSTNVFNY